MGAEELVEHRRASSFVLREQFSLFDESSDSAGPRPLRSFVNDFDSAATAPDGRIVRPSRELGSIKAEWLSGLVSHTTLAGLFFACRHASPS